MQKVLVFAGLALLVGLGVLNGGQTATAFDPVGPVAYWPFDEGGGSTAMDLAHGQDGTLVDVGPSNADGDTPPAWVSGKFGSALLFDGADDRVRVPDPADGSLDFGGTQAFTLEAWIKTDAAGAFAEIVEKQDNVNVGRQLYQMALGADGKAWCGIADGTTLVQFGGSTQIDDGVWHHIACVRDSAEGKLKIYVDGNPDAVQTETTTGTHGENGNVLIGGPADTRRNFEGVIDDVCIWNRALTTTEIGTHASGRTCWLEGLDWFDVQTEFEAATGATPLSIPAAADVGPPIAGLAYSGCADSISIPTWANNVTVTAPAANPHTSLPGVSHPICVFEPGVLVPPSNTDPYPAGPTMVANGEDDYLLVFDVPVNAVGLELLTNLPAVETVTLKDVGDNVIASLSVDSLTSPNTFQFVGFTSPTPIKSVFVDTQGGGSQNEGISAIKVPLLHVDIDIKPGSDPNCFNNDGNGVIPVAILGSVDFDVNNIEPDTVALDGLTVKIVGKKSTKLLAHVEDVNSDGYDDLVVQIQDEDGAFDSGNGTAMVTGYLYDGTPFEGTDEICIVPPS